MSELALVVEDDEDLATIFTEALQKANYQVETIRDGLAAQRRVIQIQRLGCPFSVDLPTFHNLDIFLVNP